MYIPEMCTEVGEVGKFTADHKAEATQPSRREALRKAVTEKTRQGNASLTYL